MARLQKGSTRPRSRAGLKFQIPDFWITSDPKLLRHLPGLCGYCTRRGTRLLYGRDKKSSNTTARNTGQKWEHGHVPGTNCTAVPPPVWNFNPARLRPRHEPRQSLSVPWNEYEREAPSHQGIQVSLPLIHRKGTHQWHRMRHSARREKLVWSPLVYLGVT